jgi:polysaccharide chain length determinant protein (PEP-CTERM system associated)
MMPPSTSPLEILALMLKEGRRRIFALAAIFAAFALATLAFGVLKPKEYEAHAVILLESKNIITPLMEGRAVATGITDQAAIVTQAMQSRRILRELLVFGGWGEQKNPRVEERMLNKLAGRIRVGRQRPELVKIAYVDSDPERCYAITKKLAEIYVREALFALGEARQSSAAFDFIDRQVAEYAAKLADVHAEVQAYYRDQGRPKQDATAKAGAGDARPAAPRGSSHDLAALLAEEASLVAEIGTGDVRNTRQRHADRVEQLQRELEMALRTYTENHPNVRKLRDELQTAQESSSRAAAVEERTKGTARARLAEVRRRITAASDGLPRVRPMAPQPSPGMPGVLLVPQQPTPAELLVSQDSTLSDLVRRYESTRDVYQDLLKRRENARVSMVLDAEQRGLTLRVYEEPEMPLLPTGLRLMHVTLIGLFLGVAAPLGLLFALVRFDHRVRSSSQLERTGLAPLLVAIPYAPTSADRARQRRRLWGAVAVIGGVFATYAVFLVVRLGMVP